ncbi:MAG: hypothetical protein QM760_02345 [Nibricoccus sp.]
MTSSLFESRTSALLAGDLGARAGLERHAGVARARVGHGVHGGAGFAADLRERAFGRRDVHVGAAADHAAVGGLHESAGRSFGDHARERARVRLDADRGAGGQTLASTSTTYGMPA